MPPIDRQSDRANPPRAGRSPFGARRVAGGPTLAFLLLILCGISGAAVLDPALGAWGVAIASRAEALRSARAVADEVRLAGAHAGPARLAVAPRLADAAAPSLRPDEGSRALRMMVRDGTLALPPPTLG